MDVSEWRVCEMISSCRGLVFAPHPGIFEAGYYVTWVATSRMIVLMTMFSQTKTGQRKWVIVVEKVFSVSSSRETWQNCPRWAVREVVLEGLLGL